jgi:hypothetical protein
VGSKDLKRHIVGGVRIAVLISFSLKENVCLHNASAPTSFSPNLYISLDYNVPVQVIPFLPLTREHVRQCIAAELRYINIFLYFSFSYKVNMLIPTFVTVQSVPVPIYTCPCRRHNGASMKSTSVNNLLDQVQFFSQDFPIFAKTGTLHREISRFFAVSLVFIKFKLSENVCLQSNI